MNLAALYVAIPILSYVPLFLYETYMSFNRLKAPAKKHGGYLNVTWEVTHTLLIIGVNYFIWLYADIISEVGKAVYWGLIVAGAGFIVRAIYYLYLFYVLEPAKRKRTPMVSDYIFALSHVVTLFGLVYTIVRTLIVLFTNDFSVNTQFVPYLWPGLILTFGLCALPMVSVYKTKR